jgi:hypothetical protein
MANAITGPAFTLIGTLTNGPLSLTSFNIIDQQIGAERASTSWFSGSTITVMNSNFQQITRKDGTEDFSIFC